MAQKKATNKAANIKIEIVPAQMITQPLSLA